MTPTYQKFIVPPSLKGESMTKVDPCTFLLIIMVCQVNVSLSLESIMKIDEVSGLFQVQFFLDLAWFETRLKFKVSFNLLKSQMTCFVSESKAQKCFEQLPDERELHDMGA